MCSDPEPRDHVTFAQTKRAVVSANAHDTDAVTPFFEFQRWMMRISPPERVFLSREFLNLRWKFVEMLPETPMRSADHGRS